MLCATLFLHSYIPMNLLLQVRNVFYFATNYHTLAGADKSVKIVFEKRAARDLLPKASTCR